MPTVFRLHPTINFARVGTSDEYYLSPETSAGLPVAGAGAPLGGLPIKAGTENEPISSDDLRDDSAATCSARPRGSASTSTISTRRTAIRTGGGVEIGPGHAARRTAGCVARRRLDRPPGQQEGERLQRRPARRGCRRTPTASCRGCATPALYGDRRRDGAAAAARHRSRAAGDHARSGARSWPSMPRRPRATPTARERSRELPDYPQYLPADTVNSRLFQPNGSAGLPGRAAHRRARPAARARRAGAGPRRRTTSTATRCR